MTDRDRLIELIDEAINDEETSYSNIADYLLENGVIVPPCKVGDTVYAILNNENVHEVIVSSVRILIDSNLQFLIKVNSVDENMDICNKFMLFYGTFVFGKTVFLTREAAEQALKGGVQE